MARRARSPLLRPGGRRQQAGRRRWCSTKAPPDALPYRRGGGGQVELPRLTGVLPAIIAASDSHSSIADVTISQRGRLLALTGRYAGRHWLVSRGTRPCLLRAGTQVGQGVRAPVHDLSAR
eukprot:scaffold14821_cov84-Isochrysis_galbana.AAC.1